LGITEILDGKNNPVDPVRMDERLNTGCPLMAGYTAPILFWWTNYWNLFGFQW